MMQYELSEESIHWLMRHIITLNCEVITPDRPAPQVAAFSGFVVMIDGVFFFITAGHIYTEVALWKEIGCKLSWSIFDGHAKDARHIHSYPVPPFEENVYPINNEEQGLDYAAMVIHPSIVRLMATNGVVPLTKNRWENPPEEFDIFSMLGLPNERFYTETDANGQLICQASYVSIEITQETNPPAKLVKPFPRFYARVPGIGEDAPQSIKGMSGCPIFGFKAVNGVVKFWVIAVQSGWLPSERVVAGCPFPVFTEFLRAKVSDARKRFDSVEEANVD